MYANTHIRTTKANWTLKARIATGKVCIGFRITTLNTRGSISITYAKALGCCVSLTALKLAQTLVMEKSRAKLQSNMLMAQSMWVR